MTARSMPSIEFVSLNKLATQIQNRTPRETARSEIKVTAVPLRTCYETLMRLLGPREAVLDYAAALFAEEAKCPAPPAPPLALEEAHIEDDGETLSLLLSRGMYTTPADIRDRSVN
jgi:hypothetical protein